MMSVYPIGTVVKLKENDVELTVCGYEREEPLSGEIYDYIGVHAVYGMSLDPNLIYFNEEHIDHIIFNSCADSDYNGI